MSDHSIVPPGTATKPACDCMECQIRAACGFQAGQLADLGTPIIALTMVLAECLAHVSTPAAKTIAQQLLVGRKKWQRHPRVAVQHTEGNAP